MMWDYQTFKVLKDSEFLKKKKEKVIFYYKTKISQVKATLLSNWGMSSDNWQTKSSSGNILMKNVR